jgi:hypothetical protein
VPYPGWGKLSTRDAQVPLVHGVFRQHHFALLPFCLCLGGMLSVQLEQNRIWHLAAHVVCAVSHHHFNTIGEFDAEHPRDGQTMQPGAVPLLFDVLPLACALD